MFWGYAESPELQINQERLANMNPGFNVVSNFHPTDPQMESMLQKLPPQLPPDR